MLNNVWGARFARGVRRALAVIVASSSTVSAAATAGAPVLQVTAPNGQQSILIGALHVPIDGLREPAASIFTGARHYVIEHDGTSTLPANGTSPEWAKSLSDHEVDIYIQRLKCLGMDEDAALRWLREPTPQVANALAYSICPLPSAQARDVYLAGIVPPELKTHPEVLEDANWVEQQRRLVPASANASAFGWTLAHDPNVVLSKIRDALNIGDYDAVRGQVLESFGSESAAAAYGKHMVDERNAEWLPRLEAVLNDGHAVVVVGAMHFPGPTGLVALLRRQGYAVDAIEWPAAGNNAKSVR